GQSVSGDENSRRLNDEHAVPTIRFARPRSNSLAAIVPARVASSIHASWALLRAQSSWVLLFLPPPNPPPQAGEGAHRVHACFTSFAGSSANPSRRRGRTRSSIPARSPAAPIGADISQAPSP